MKILQRKHEKNDASKTHRKSLRWLLKPQSVLLKFFYFTVGLAIVPVFIILGMMEWQRYHENFEKLEKKLDKLSASQSLLIAEPLWHAETEQLNLQFATLLSDPDVLSIEIFNQEQERLFTFGDPRSKNQRLTRKHSISYVVDNDIQVLGVMELALTDKHIAGNVKQRFNEHGLLLCLVIFMLLTAYVGLYLIVGNALNKLLHSITLFDEKGIVEPVFWKSNDEVGKVVAAYNAMQSSQQQALSDLQKAHDELEKRVLERTALLRNEVQERCVVESKLRGQEQELKTFLDGVPVMLWMLSPNGRSMRFNESWLQFTGLTHQQEVQLQWTGEDIHEDYRQQCIKTYNRSISNKQPFALEYPKLNGLGEYRWISEIGVPRFNDDDQYLGYFGTSIDITKRKETEQLLYEEKEKAQVTLHSIGEGVITTDEKGIVLFLNPKAEQLTGLMQQDAISHPLHEIFKIYNHSSREQLPDPALSCIKQQQTITHEQTILFINRLGREFFIKDSTAAIFNQQKQVIGTVLVFVDVTESIRLSQKLSYQASHDSLTGLVNRREFENRLRRVLITAKDNGSVHALCYIDLDQFKIINDTCGHVAGDELLKKISDVLQHGLRKRDTLARLGGDEFGVLMEHCSLEQATAVAEKLCQSIHVFRFHWGKESFSLGISIGVVMIDASIHDMEELLIDADSACYAAKSAGRGRVHVYKDNDETLTKHQGEMQWTTRINNALDADRFCLYFQPIFSALDKKTIHCEILLRMQDEQGNIVMPGRFLPAAERYDLLICLDRWVISNAFAWITGLPESGLKITQFGINLSGHSLSDAVFADFIIDQLKRYHIVTHSICFEITETAVIDNPALAIETINRLRALGCKFALDDFGTGLSSFTYLKQFPVDYLKIDGLFVKGVCNDEIDLKMVSAINQIGHVMGKMTVAECVEDECTFLALQKMPVDYIQGYYLSQPMPISDYQGFLTSLTNQHPAYELIKSVSL